jgi:hypothetical protein
VSTLPLLGSGKTDYVTLKSLTESGAAHGRGQRHH